MCLHVERFRNGRIPTSISVVREGYVLGSEPKGNELPRAFAPAITVIWCETVQRTPMADNLQEVSAYNHRKNVGSHVDGIHDDFDSGRWDAEVETDNRLGAFQR